MTHFDQLRPMKTLAEGGVVPQGEVEQTVTSGTDEIEAEELELPGEDGCGTVAHRSGLDYDGSDNRCVRRSTIVIKMFYLFHGEMLYRD